MVRKIIFCDKHFIEFYQNQDEKVKSKIQYVFELIKQVDKVPEKFLKHLSGTNGYMKLGLNINLIYLESSLVLMKAD